ncbi:hypothetical protein M4D57_26385 [Brevibacillus borstelensis]|uniref:hypothetical protein n=1 Tax=Brevibacillus borstelensis TaxID=45462 RepID=UPI0004681A65|nr:hypothetical protein [Brevibacillus borstelensis]MCM3562000.1 hypothetical protein [Brevibacillus borstelensis]
MVAILRDKWTALKGRINIEQYPSTFKSVLYLSQVSVVIFLLNNTLLENEKYDNLLLSLFLVIAGLGVGWKDIKPYLKKCHRRVKIDPGSPE